MLKEQRQMLQALLADRFRLRCHREMRSSPVYVLLRGNGALRLVEPKDKSTYPAISGIRGPGLTGDGVVGKNLSMEDWASILGFFFEKPIVNETAISGAYDFRFEYPPDDQKPDLPSLMAACVRGIGLRLRPATREVEFVVIDGAEKPTSN